MQRALTFHQYCRAAEPLAVRLQRAAVLVLKIRVDLRQDLFQVGASLRGEPASWWPGWIIVSGHVRDLSRDALSAIRVRGTSVGGGLASELRTSGLGRGGCRAGLNPASGVWARTPPRNRLCSPRLGMEHRLRKWLHPNLRLLLARFALVGEGRSPCSEHPRTTSIAAQQNR